eukprot:7638332-Pyramimonas_sp.AAC.1
MPLCRVSVGILLWRVSPGILFRGASVGVLLRREPLGLASAMPTQCRITAIAMPSQCQGSRRNLVCGWFHWEPFCEGGQCQRSANGMPNQRQGDPNLMPMQPQWSGFFVFAFNDIPPDSPSMDDAIHKEIFLKTLLHWISIGIRQWRDPQGTLQWRIA